MREPFDARVASDVFRFKQFLRLAKVRIASDRRKPNFRLRYPFVTTKPNICSPFTTMSSSRFRPLLRARLRSNPANGHSSFTPSIRKLVFEYCDKWPSSANTRTFILNHLEQVARTHPHVELVVKQRTFKEPIIRGFYGMSWIANMARFINDCAQSMTGKRS